MHLRLINSSKCRVLGYNGTSSELVPEGWLLEEIVPPDKQPCRYIIGEFKFLDRGRVYFYKKGGIVEDNTHSMVYEYLTM